MAFLMYWVIRVCISGARYNLTDDTSHCIVTLVFRSVASTFPRLLGESEEVACYIPKQTRNLC